MVAFAYNHLLIMIDNLELVVGYFFTFVVGMVLKCYCAASSAWITSAATLARVSPV
jgi:hypothetical protein